jgi:hypothetical protein
VGPGRDESRALERGGYLLVGDRAVRALAEAEELEPPVADGREIPEHGREAARERHERAKVCRVRREIVASEVARHRAVGASDGVADRPLLQTEPVVRDESSTALAEAHVCREGTDGRCPDCPDRRPYERPAVDPARVPHLRRSLRRRLEPGRRGFAQAVGLARSLTPSAE